MKTRVLLLVTIGLVCLLAPAAWSLPAVELGATTVVVNGITPNGAAVILGAVRDRTGHQTVVWHYQQILTDTEGRGTVVLEPQAPLDQSSLWAVIDLASGAIAVAASGGGLLVEDPVPSDLLSWEQDGTVGAFGTRLRAADLIVVRPGIGAWFISARDGGADDLDGEANGVLMLDPDDLEPVDPGSTETLGNLAPGDVVLALSPQTLHFYQQLLSEQS